jgi:peptidoglycan pentaglycine glycine transferase (the first glycine)
MYIKMTNLKAKILDSKDKTIWNKFVDASKWGDVLQMWEWGELKKSENWRPVRVGIVQDGRLIMAVQLLLKSASILGNYAYIPHGPVFLNKQDLIKALPVFTQYLHILNKTYNFASVEIEPKFGELIQTNVEIESQPNISDTYLDSEVMQIFLDAGFIQTGRNVQPQYKLLYDLAQSLDDLLLLAKKNTRYNVRLAEKKGVEIREYFYEDEVFEEKINIFYQLIKETQKRAKGYPARSLNYYRSLFKFFSGSQSIVLTEASYQGDVIAMNISLRTSSWSSSFYAGSNRLHPNLKAMYLLRWKSIESAKKFGSKMYDFWGYVPNSTQHQGYSDQKLSFGGTQISTYGVLSFPLNPVKFWLWDEGIKTRTELAIKSREWSWKIKESIKNNTAKLASLIKTKMSITKDKKTE